MIRYGHLQIARPENHDHLSRKCDITSTKGSKA